MRRRVGAIALAVLLVLPGALFAVGPAAATDHEDAPPDPANDTLGWEEGYWYNESLSINQSDGLSAEERTAVIARTMARIEHVRGLEFERTVPVSIRSRAELRERITNRSTDPTLRTFDNVKFEALFLIGESEDSIEVQNENSGAAILGYYSPGNDSIVLVAENASAVRLDEATLAHELVHALQDQHYNLSNYRGRTRDEVNAIDGLIEGDASYVEYLYMNRRCDNPDHPWNGTCIRPPGEGSGGDLANIGVYFVKFQPYSDGPAFIRYVRSKGGWEAVNALYEAPPESAEQVIHPAKYGEDAPTNVTLTDRTSGTWERVRPPGRPDYAEVGESSIASMIAYPLYAGGSGGRIVPPREWLNYTVSGEISSFDPLNYGFAAAAGWDGDRMHVYRNAENETAYVWRIVWDSPGEAEEFLASYREVLRYWGGAEVAPNTYRIEEGRFADAFRIAVSGATITIVNAPTVGELTAVRTEPTPTPTVSPTASPSPSTPPETRSTTSAPPPTSISATSTPGQPGFGAAAMAVALVLVLALAARRRR